MTDTGSNKGTMLVASRSATSRQTTTATSPALRDLQPDVQGWAELRERLAARGAELQQSVLSAAESARRYDAVGDHLLGGMHWRKAHLDQVRLAELERTYALVDDLARRDLPRPDRARPDSAPADQGYQSIAGLAA